MAKFTIGQRWISETEPELGLGIVEEVSRHQVRLAFAASAEARLYAPTNAPIKRVEFRAGDTIHSQGGETIVIEEVKVEEGIITYLAGAVEIAEMDLADTISFSKPEDRLIRGKLISRLPSTCATRPSPGLHMPNSRTWLDLWAGVST